MNSHLNHESPISALNQHTNRTVRVYNNELGEFIGRITNIVETGDIDTDYLELEYYTEDGVLTSEMFLPIELFFPELYLPDEYYYRYGYHDRYRYPIIPWNHRRPLDYWNWNRRGHRY